MFPDRRFRLQIFVSACLVALPISLICVNGETTFRRILADESQTNEPEKAKLETDVENASKRLTFGIYDPNCVTSETSPLKIRHLYYSWLDLEPANLKQDLDAIVAQDKIPMLTIEPWPEVSDSGSLLKSTVEGRYDHLIAKLCDGLRDCESEVYLVWGHEMDQELTERYPWSGQPHEDYVSAFRYVVNKVRANVDTDIRWVWAGVMKDKSIDYWPGDSFVDFVGIPVYSFPSWDREHYGYIRDFSEIFSEKLSYLPNVKKPILITELGVVGSDDFKNYWLRHAFLTFSDFDSLTGIVFFSARDTDGVWGEGVNTPDWTLDPALIDGFVNWKLSEFTSPDVDAPNHKSVEVK